MTKLDYFWASNDDWCHWTEYGELVVNDDAPEEAKQSYKNYLEQKSAAEKRGTI